MPRVLAVDDDEYVLRAYGRILRSRADLVGVASGQAALDLLRDDQAFDLILCDLQMPDIDGPAFHAALASSHPALAENFNGIRKL